MKKGLCPFVFVCAFLLLMGIIISSRPVLEKHGIPEKEVNKKAPKSGGSFNLNSKIALEADCSFHDEINFLSALRHRNLSSFNIKRESFSTGNSEAIPMAITAPLSNFNSDIRVNSYAPGGQIQPAVVTGNDGTIYVAWSDSTGPHPLSIYFARSTDGGATFTPRKLVDSNGPNINPSIGVYGTGSGANV